ncbi:MAG: hypothetical protein JF886_00045, partial [Candidatus Dormibacteraeota bacterium]|nr:hypothetical protein [Candidatus Dormibacteraeota bacterium]
MHGRVLIWAGAGLALLVGAPLLVSAHVGAAAAAAQDQAGPHRVIVVLKQQAFALPATKSLVGQRRSALARAQSPVVAQLARAGAGNIHS